MIVSGEPGADSAAINRAPLDSSALFIDSSIPLVGEEAEDSHAVLCADVNLAIDDKRSNEFISITKGVSAIGGLVAVVKLMLKVGRVVSMKNGWSGQC